MLCGNAPRLFGTALMALALLLAACSDPTSASLYSLSYPTAFGLVCQESQAGSYEAVALADCKAAEDGSQRLLAVVANGPTGDFAFIDLRDGDAIDTDRTIPGFTRLYVGGYLSDLAVHPSSSHVYAVDTMGPRLIVLNPASREWTALDLSFRPYRLAITPAGDALLLSAPEQGSVVRIPLDDAGEPGEPEFAQPGGAPGSIAVSEDGTQVLVAHLYQRYVSRIDPVTLEEVARIGFVEACRDGLDNDGDGLVDGADGGCLDAADNDETDPVVCSADVTEDCLDPAALPACANGLDDDGDGQIDLADAGCLNRSDWTEGTNKVNLLDGDPNPFACANGLDDDGDGLVDYPEDPDCFAAGSNSERGLPDPMAEVAVSPDGHLAYVTYPSRLEVMVLDLDNETLLDVNAIDDTLARVMRAREGVLGVALAYVPQKVNFQQLEDRLYAYIADDGGRSSRVLVEEAGAPVHQVDSATDEEDRTEAAKPRLYVDGSEIQLGYTPIASVPNIGPLLVETLDEETETKRYYGIEFDGELRAHRNETWMLTYEGRLPGTGSLTARLFNDGTVSLLNGDLCALGVLPGDLFEMAYDKEYNCGEVVPDGTYTWTIEEVGADWLKLSAEGEGRYVETITTELGEEEEDVVVTVGLPETNCFGRLVSFSIRAAGSFVVTGTRSGYLHNVISTAQGCQEDPDGDPRMTGRAYVATLKDDAALPSCPVTEAVEALEVTPFVNPFFTFSIYPACQELADGGREVIDSKRGTEWRFGVSSGFVSQTILAAKNTADQVLSPAQDLLYVLDMAGRGIKEIELEEFLLQASYY